MATHRVRAPGKPDAGALGAHRDKRTVRTTPKAAFSDQNLPHFAKLFPLR